MVKREARLYINTIPESVHVPLTGYPARASSERGCLFAAQPPRTAVAGTGIQDRSIG